MLLDLKQAAVLSSEGVTASLRQDWRTRKAKSAVRVDYDFSSGGFVTVRLPVSLPLPENYRLSLKLAAEMASQNTVQIKLIDSSLQNVWWVQRRNLSIGRKWQKLENKKRHVTWAWGVSKEPLAAVSYIEITMLSGSLARGHFYLGDLTFEELPAAASSPPPPTVTASSGKATAGNVTSGDSYTPDWPTGPGWRSTSRHRRQWLKLEFGGWREFGGLVVDWADGAFALDYKVQIRTGGRRWHTVDTVSGATGGRQHHMLPECEATALRLMMTRPAIPTTYMINHVEVKPLAFGASANDFLAAIAPDFAPGEFPRYVSGEATYWTVVGVSGAFNETLLSEDGAIELGRGMPSLEPFLFDGRSHRLLTWKDGEHSQCLEEGYLPLPAVTRTHQESALSLSVHAFATGEAGASTVYLRYTVTNDDSEGSNKQGVLFLGVRPHQVNPPWQGLRSPGGHAPIYRLERLPDGIAINGSRAVVPLTQADRFTAGNLSRGGLTDTLTSLCMGFARGDAPACDPHGFAWGALGYSFDLAPGESRTVYVAVPLSQASVVLPDGFQLRNYMIAWWKRKLANIDIDILQGAGQEMVDTIKAQVAYILINRQGPMIVPGKRNYLRTWIRDSALISEALLQLGYFDEVREFITWFAPYIFSNGKVPCCVDERGPDPTPENDSHGEFIHLVCRYYRYTSDRKLLKEMFPYIMRVVGYIEQLRQSTRTKDFLQPGRKHLYGLLPPSISHEGYGTPAYSYFDNVFALVGLNAAGYLAAQLGRYEESNEINRISLEFRDDLVCSVNRVLVDRDIEYIPGAADLGDKDPTSITIWLELTTLLSDFPRALPATFDLYWRLFIERQSGNWADYTPYELRAVSSLLRLNQVERAHRALDFFMDHRRPRGWRHWAEVVCSNQRFGRYIGDMPHTWVGSDFLRSALSCFAYEDPQLGLIVGRGLTAEWLTAGIKCGGLRTAFGKLSIYARQDNEKVVFSLRGDVRQPVRVAVPAGFSKACLLSGQPVAIDPGTNTIVVPAQNDTQSPPLCAAIVFTR